MKKLLIASAVSAAFAAPTVALAQAARAPTLSQVLGAGGIEVPAHVDAGSIEHLRERGSPGRLGQRSRGSRERGRDCRCDEKLLHRASFRGWEKYFAAFLFRLQTCQAA